MLVRFPLVEGDRVGEVHPSRDKVLHNQLNVQIVSPMGHSWSAKGFRTVAVGVLGTQATLLKIVVFYLHDLLIVPGADETDISLL